MRAEQPLECGCKSSELVEQEVSTQGLRRVILLACEHSWAGGGGGLQAVERTYRLGILGVCI